MKSVKKVPLATMLKNMERFDKEADKLYGELQELRQRRPSGTKQLVAYMKELVDAWSVFRECTLDAQRFAVDAAPFMHQRLSATTHTIQGPVTKPSGEMTEEQKVDYFNKLRLRPASHVPLEITLDNETGEVVES